MPVKALAETVQSLFPDGVPPLGLAVSGGLDSMVLMEAAHRVGWSRLPCVLHFDHGLREESAADAAFVSEQAEARDLACECRREDLAALHEEVGGSLEGLAREARYAWLAERATKHGLAAVVTAQHRDDQVESVALHLLRGSSWRGLMGMQRSRPLSPDGDALLLRPFLDITRDELETAAATWNLEWREDPSNRDVQHKRNRLRSEVLPELGDEVGDRLLRLGERAATMRRRIERMARTLGDGERDAWSVELLTSVPEPVAREMVERRTRAYGLEAVPRRPWEQVLAGDGTFELRRDLHLVRRGGIVTLRSAGS